MSLGFEPENLFVSQSNLGTIVSIKKNGDNFCNFQATNEPTKKTNDQFTTDWAAATATWNASSREEKQKLIEASVIRQYAVSIVMILSIEGILPTDVVDFICPFCSGKVTANQTKYSISHSLPVCEKFKNLEPTEFLAASVKQHIN
jgi:hypothetical protein